jgi:hypothetical protein
MRVSNAGNPLSGGRKGPQHCLFDQRRADCPQEPRQQSMLVTLISLRRVEKNVRQAIMRDKFVRTPSSHREVIELNEPNRVRKRNTNQIASAQITNE